MSKIIFIYRENKYEILLENKNSNIFYEFSKKIDANLNDLTFLYKGKYISLNNSQIIINMLKSNKNIIISVYNLIINQKNDNVYENLICPNCKNLTFLNLNGSNLNNCYNKKINKNECSYEYKSITEFMNVKLLMRKCKNYKYLYGKIFIFVLEAIKYVNYVLISMKKIISII